MGGRVTVPTEYRQHRERRPMVRSVGVGVRALRRTPDGARSQIAGMPVFGKLGLRGLTVCPCALCRGRVNASRRTASVILLECGHARFKPFVGVGPLIASEGGSCEPHPEPEHFAPGGHSRHCFPVRNGTVGTPPRSELSGWIPCPDPSGYWARFSSVSRRSTECLEILENWGSHGDLTVEPRLKLSGCDPKVSTAVRPEPPRWGFVFT